MMDEKKYHLINDYLSGDLQGTALDKFRIDLKNNPELQETVKMQEMLIAGINKHRDAELKAIINGKTKPTAMAAPTKVVAMGNGVKLALASAAAITLLVVGYFALEPYIQDYQAQIALEDYNEDKEEVEDTETTTNSISDTGSQTLALAENKPDDDLLDEETSPSVELEEDNLINDETSKDEVTFEETELDDFDNVRTDVLLGNRSYSVNSISPTFATVTETATAAKEIRGKAKPQSDYKVLEEKVSASAEDTKAVTKSVNVEYWKSVVNFKGYKYDGNKVQLYGVSEDKTLIFMELDDRLYVKIDGKQYYIEPNRTHKRLTEVTNTTLLNVLND